MALREELWTVEVGRRIAKLKRTREQIAGLAALAEHARAVRIVKRELAERERTLANAALPSFDYDWVEPQVVVLRRILDILQKGRA